MTIREERIHTLIVLSLAQINTRLRAREIADYIIELDKLSKVLKQRFENQRKHLWANESRYLTTTNKKKDRVRDIAKRLRISLSFDEVGEHSLIIRVNYARELQTIKI